MKSQKTEHVSRRPGRPRSFDVGAALDAAVAVFWAKGFDGTTYSDLEDATGQHRQSLVYAFGDKQALFSAALQRYVERRVSIVCEALRKGEDPAAAIRRALGIWSEDANRKVARGCLLVNTAGEVRGHGGEAARHVETARRMLVAAFTDVFRRAAAAKQLRIDIDPALAAELVVAAGDGALLHARSSGSGLAARKALLALATALLK